MKNYLFIFAVILIGSVSGFGQKTAPAVKVVPVRPAENAATPPVAEKFDPARDPVVDLKDAVIRAQASGKRIILDVGGEWCSWCHYLDNFFAKNTGLMKLREDNFIWQKINMSEDNENKAFLAAYPNVPGYPHLFVLESDGTFLHSQDTSVLELEKSYNLDKMTDFLKKWSPVKTPQVVK